jgi:2-polyprenyl-3-methyl-5-hydroxy-6-metoxy-1,4-benzoquinol methylase
LNDKAGEKYWSSVWKKSVKRKSSFHALTGVRNYTTIQLDSYFQAHLESFNRSNATKLLEVGCANSAWLPYFSQRFGFAVTGIDYSEVGVEQAKEVLFEERVEGTVIEADVFEKNEQLAGAFDIVVSFGLVEHFSPPSDCIRAMSKYLKPGGLMITLVPNFVGVCGSLQKMLNRDVYNTHCLLSAQSLSEEHHKAGLKTIAAEYLVSCNFGVCSVGDVSGVSPRRTFLFLLRVLSMIPGAIEYVWAKKLASRRWSPYVLCVARLRGIDA